VPLSALRALHGFMADPLLSAERVAQASQAAARLCAWVRAQVGLCQTPDTRTAL
jgi:hypothetical protein